MSIQRTPDKEVRCIAKIVSAPSASPDGKIAQIITFDFDFLHQCCKTLISCISIDSGLDCLDRETTGLKDSVADVLW
jgi:hypothetical protein